MNCGLNVLAPKYGRGCLTIIRKEKEVALAVLQKAAALGNRQIFERDQKRCQAN